MSAVEQLIRCDPFDYSAATAQLFSDALRETVSWHYDQCREYRNYLDYCRFSPSELRGSQDVARLPFIHVNIYKEYDLKSVSDSEIKLTLTSSGTGGKKK